VNKLGNWLMLSSLLNLRPNYFHFIPSMPYCCYWKATTNTFAQQHAVIYCWWREGR